MGARHHVAGNGPLLPVIDDGTQTEIESCPPTEIESCPPTEIIVDSDEEYDRELSVRAPASASAPAPLTSASALAPPTSEASSWLGLRRSRSPVATRRSASGSQGVIRVVSSGRLACLPVSERSSSSGFEGSSRRRPSGRRSTTSTQQAPAERCPEGVQESGQAIRIVSPGRRQEEVSRSQGVDHQGDEGWDVWWANDDEVLAAEVGTQLMNGSAHDGYVDVNAREPDSIFPLGAWDFMPAEEAMLSNMYCMMPTSVQELGSVGVAPSSALAVCGSLHRVVALTPITPLCDLESDAESNEEQLVSKGVEVSGCAIRAVIADGNSFYIGITENFDRRWDEHVWEFPSWYRMDVLVRARSSAVTAPIERELIKTFKSVLLCHNSGLGGERASGGMPHYVYLLVGPPLLRRH